VGWFFRGVVRCNTRITNIVVVGVGVGGGGGGGGGVGRER